MNQQDLLQRAERYLPGACLGMSLVFVAVKILTEMATFDEAGVSERNE